MNSIAKAPRSQVSLKTHLPFSKATTYMSQKMGAPQNNSIVKLQVAPASVKLL